MSSGGRCWLATLALVPGCLSAPPDAIGDDSGPPADAVVGDGGTSCASIVQNNFLSEEMWFSSTSGSGVLDLFNNHVEIRIVPAAEAGFVELASQEERPIEGTRVEADLVVDRSDAGNVSISFDGTADGGGFYEIAVADGVVQSVHADQSVMLLCGGGCPAYDRDLHQRFRLRARQERVYYESFDGQEWTELVPSEPASPAAFTVSLKSIGNEGEGEIDALLRELSWQDCLE